MDQRSSIFQPLVGLDDEVSLLGECVCLTGDTDWYFPFPFSVNSGHNTDQTERGIYAGWHLSKAKMLIYSD